MLNSPLGSLAKASVFTQLQGHLQLQHHPRRICAAKYCNQPIDSALPHPNPPCGRPLPPELLATDCQTSWHCLTLDASSGFNFTVQDAGLNLYLNRYTKRRYPVNLQGVGARSDGIVWFFVIVFPLFFSWLIVKGVDVAPLNHFEPVNTWWIVLPLLAAILLMKRAGSLERIPPFHPDLRDALCDQEYDKNLLPYEQGPLQTTCMFLYIFLSVICTTASFRAAHVEFCLPEVSTSSLLMGVNLCIIFIANQCLWWLAWNPWYDYVIPDNELLFRCFLHLFARFGLAAFLPPGISFYVVCAYFKCKDLQYFNCWADTTERCTMFQTIIYPTDSVSQIFLVLPMFCAYSRDRKFVSLTGIAVSFAFRWARHGNNAGMIAAVPYIALLVFVYLCALYGRSQRVLSAELQKVRYVRIGHLRRMHSQGKMIKRCQDMPEEAFGNVTKASKLIIISHRWLDRYTCDVATDQYPHGLRLTTMLEKLETYFPSSWSSFLRISSSSLLLALSALLQSIKHAEYDVLVFFDFIGVPQIGMNADGSLIQRTPEEQQIFEEALPAMGGLYTMYDVMVCPEVPEGVADYESSGWCFCEWESAYLYRKLNHYSSEIVASRPEPVDFLSSFEKELATKKFFYDKDRDTVRVIILGKMKCSRLINAVDSQDVGMVRDMLREMKEHGLLAAIDEPIDEVTLDSLLHMAVRLPSQEIVDLLIEYGAKEDARNLAGDTPYQLLMFPRCCRASH